MGRRVFWITLGAVAGVLIVRRLGKAVEAYTPAGMGQTLAGIGEGIKELAAAIRDGMHEREDELRIALGVDTGTLDPDVAQSLIEDPTGPRRPSSAGA
jgi:hypothetical protein